MAVSAKKIVLWRKEVADEPGVLREVLAPLAEAGANLRVVMGYGIPGQPGRAAVEVYPITGRKVVAAANRAGLQSSPIPCLLVEGDDRPGLAGQMATSIAALGINIAFVAGGTVGRRFSSVFGFHTDADATAASKAIKSAARTKAKARKR